MNYALHYSRLIERAERRELEGYSERHHVVPRCVDKTSTYTVRLTPEEHYVAHQLLVKLYPKNYGLAHALALMTGANEYQLSDNKLYGWIRRRVAEASSAYRHSDETREKMSLGIRAAFANGAKRVDQTTPEYRAAHPPRTGWTHTSETVAKIIAGHLGHKRSAESCQRMSEAQSAREHQLHTSETIEKMKIAQRAFWDERGGHSDEAKAVMRDKQLASVAKRKAEGTYVNVGFKGGKHTPETIALCVAASKGHKVSPERIATLIQRNKDRGAAMRKARAERETISA